jgi:outer membrane protein assembly factor BamB
MKKTRLRWVLVAVGLCGGLHQAVAVRAQEVQPQVPRVQIGHRGQDQGSPFTERVKLASDPKTRRNLREAIRLIGEKDWSQAIRVLQILLDGKEDYFVEVTEGESKGRRISIRAEANRLLSTLPREGKQFYEQQFGGQAKALLRKGMANNDPQVYAEVALRYLHTDAGAEAAALLASYHLDHGQYIVAALCYERLMDRENGVQRLTPLQLYKAALAFERAGDVRNRQRAWEAFQAKVDQPGETPLPSALRRMSPKNLEEGLAGSGETKLSVSRDDWVMFMGSPDRAARGVGGVPFLDANSFRLDLNKPFVSTFYNHAVRGLLETAVKRQSSVARPVMSGFHPLAVGNDLIYRSYWGIHAYNLKDRAPRWENALKVSLHVLHQPENKADQANQFPGWRDYWLQQAPFFFFDNSLQGTISTDQTLVYAVEDLAVPPVTNEARFGMPRGGAAVTDTLAPWYVHNKLVAFEISTGRVAWEIGTTNVENDPFADTFFLGPPLPLGGKLYVLAEANREIRLLCLESRPAWLPLLNREGHKVELVWSQPLCLVETPLTQDPRRRTQAAHLSYGEGLLICPTNAGMVLAVDLLTRTLVWAQPYQVDPAQSERNHEMIQPGIRRGGARFGGGMPMEGMNTSSLNETVWCSAAPVLQQGYVVFTAYDSLAVHCLRLRDGTHVWKHDRDDEKEGRFLYLAGIFDGKVLLVGSKSCRALNLTDGKTLWTVPTGKPSGRGVASGSTYFLPLASGEVWALDLTKGEITSKSKSRREVPGNLVFHDGDVFSQGVQAITCYPQLEVAEKKITARLQANPHDPVGLAERGKIRLYRGNAADSVQDLRAALVQPSLDESLRQDTQERLYEALCDLLDRNFVRYEAELPALEKLVPLPALNTEDADAKTAHETAQLERRINLFRLLAKGRANQGRMGDALAACLAAADLKPLMVHSPEDRSLEIRPLDWAQGKVEAMLQDPQPGRREALLQAIDQQWSAARADGSLDALRRFANFFHPLCPQGRDAQLLTAQKLLAQPTLRGTGAEFEALVRLHTLDRDPDPQRAAQAVEGLARLNTRLGALETAAFHYRQLARKYPRVIVRDGKTGEELFLELATDKRFLPYLDDPKRGINGAAGLEFQGNFSRSPLNKGISQMLWAEVPDEHFPFRLGVDLSRKDVVLVDAYTGRERDRFRLLQQDPLMDISGADSLSGPSVQLLSGQVILFTWGRHVYAYDPFVKRGLLWTYDLLNNVTEENPAYQPNRNPQQMIVGAGKPRLVRASGGGVEESLGMVGMAGENGICFPVRDKGLVMVDALTGKERWVREGVPTSAELFSDGSYVFLCVPYKIDSTPAHSQALRVRDGTPVAAPQFVTQFQKRKDAFGRYLLLQDTENTGRFQVRLYDVLTGQDAWKQTFEAKALIFNSLVRQTVGGIDPDGRLRIFELPSGQLLLQGYLPPAGLKDVKECHLLRDTENWYVACNRHVVDEQGGVGAMAAPAPALNPGQTFMRPATTLASIYVEGPLLAFERTSGRMLWQVELPKQCLVVEQFLDLPLLIGASTQQTRPPGQAGNPNGASRFAPLNTFFLAVDKRTGQKIYSTSRTSSITFHALNIDPRGNLIEMYSFMGNNPLRLSFQGKPATGERPEKAEK